ncbi:hypothetical protein [Halorussus caseinilyticus]|uniref:Phage abortive infection protein n=1 Tax=Halorussus caseinilyticus TaxID=3034025 RepID=A0ABD5WTE6_9EURY|nr:hypothetical protein [Halorussus sp. DT72]
MNRDDLQLIFVGISALTGLVLVLFRLSNSESNYLNWIPSIFRGWVGTALLTLIVIYLGWQIFKVLWSSGDEDTENWYEEVERTANGIQQTWHYSGTRPEDEDRKRTVEEMDKLTDELKEHRRHQNATDEMTEVMNEIIQRWDDCRELILISHGSHYYSMREFYFSENAERLKELLNRERQGRLQRGISKIVIKVRNSVEWIREKIHNLRSISIPYEVHKELKNHLTTERLSNFNNGDHYLFILGEHSYELVHYEHDEDKFNMYKLRYDFRHSPIAIDLLSGYTVSPDMLLTRIEEAEMVDTIPAKFFTRSGYGLEALAESDPMVRHPDPREDDDEESEEQKVRNKYNEEK